MSSPYYRISVTLPGSDLLDDRLGVNVSTSFEQLKESIGESLRIAYPEATVEVEFTSRRDVRPSYAAWRQVTLHDNSGMANVLVLGDEKIIALVKRVYETFDWLAMA